jgi:hypothetical protein
VLQYKKLAVRAENAPITQKEGDHGKLRDSRKEGLCFREKNFWNDSGRIEMGRIEMINH